MFEVILICTALASFDDGEVITEAVEAVEAKYEDLKVSPAGVDQSKVVPYLMGVIKDLNDRLKVLEK